MSVSPIDELEERRQRGKPQFEVIDEGTYRLDFPGLGIEFVLDHVRRERHQLTGELAVRCDIAGARTFDGVLSIGDFNVSSVQARSSRAKYLAALAQTNEEIDWLGLLEQLAQRTLAAERTGRPDVILGDVPRPEPSRAAVVDGIPILTQLPMIVFGDGDSLKSYLVLYVAGMLAHRGHRVALYDWELSEDDHRERLGLIFGEQELPRIVYKRCRQPLFHMAESIRRSVRDNQIEHAFFDSIGFACDGKPEDSDVAGRYFHAVSQLGPIGTCHVAHVAKSSENADQKPFGSAFWHNGARSTWNVKRAETAPDDAAVSIALHHRKSNTARRSPSIGFDLTFLPDRTVIRRTDPGDHPQLAAGVSLSQRLRALVRTPRTREELEAELEDVKADTLKRTINRALKAGTLVRFPGSVERIGLPYGGQP